MDFHLIILSLLTLYLTLPIFELVENIEKQKRHQRNIEVGWSPAYYSNPSYRFDLLSALCRNNVH